MAFKLSDQTISAAPMEALTRWRFEEADRAAHWNSVQRPEWASDAWTEVGRIMNEINRRKGSDTE